MSNAQTENIQATEFPKSGSSGSGSETGYSVEARYNYPQPKIIAGVIYHKDWRHVHPQQGVLGVPVAHPQQRHIIEHGLMSYPAAQAIRWWLHAIAASEEFLGGLCLETRLIEHRISYSYKETLTSSIDVVCGNHPTKTDVSSTKEQE